MKDLKDIITESKPKREWCLWDYTEHGVHEILIWKGNGRDQSDVSEVDENGDEMLNVEFEEIEMYLKNHNLNEIDKLHLDVSNADLAKIPTIFK